MMDFLIFWFQIRGCQLGYFIVLLIIVLQFLDYTNNYAFTGSRTRTIIAERTIDGHLDRLATLVDEDSLFPYSY